MFRSAEVLDGARPVLSRPDAVRTGRRRAVGLVAIVVGALGAVRCGPADRVHVFPPRCSPLRVGDSAYASAGSHRGTDGWTAVATSDASPERFRWGTRNARIAEVSPRGLVRARAPGSTWLVVTTYGVTDSAQVAVAPPSGVRVWLRPVPPYTVAVGETARVRLEVGPDPPSPAFTADRIKEPRLSARHAAVAFVEATRSDAGVGWVYPTDWRLIGRGPGRDELEWLAGGRCGVAALTVIGPKRP